MVSLVLVMMVFSVLVQSFAEIEQTTDQEILFQGIPWGINVIELKKKMNEIGYGRSDKNANKKAYGAVSWGYTLHYKKTNEPKSKLFNVAGLDIEHVITNCTFSVIEGKISKKEEDSKFFIAGYHFASAFGERTFNSLREKLSELYGNPVLAPYPTTIMTVFVTTWFGANNTYVLLTEGSIMYGILGLDEDFEYIDSENLRLEKESKLKEEEDKKLKEKREEDKKLKESKDNFEGL